MLSLSQLCPPVTYVIPCFFFVVIRDQQGLCQPAGFLKGIARVGVRVDIQLPHPNPYPSHGFRGF